MSVETKEKRVSLFDHVKVEQFAGQVISDLSANMSGAMSIIGHELGLYKAMAGAGPLTAAELAEKTQTFMRYVQEWLNNQAAGGYLVYNPDEKTYELPAEHAIILAAEDSPGFMTAGFYIVSSLWQDKDLLVQAFKTGEGLGWHEHHHNLFFGTEAFFRSGYKANLLNTWIPSLPGVVEKLEKGGRVADIGCGHGASTLMMAERFPNSVFYGFDYHPGSVQVATQRAAEAGLTNVVFEVAAADNFSTGNFDLVCFMDAFHDFGNPFRAVEHAKTKLATDGSLLIVEPASSDKVEENFNVVGRMFYAASTAFCVPHSHSQDGDYCLGAQAGPGAVEDILKQAGYSQFRIVQKSPVNLVYEAKI